MFEERLRAQLPLAADRILHRVRETRGGTLYDPRFGVRGRGQGPYAASIEALFQTSARRLGLSTGCADAQTVTCASFNSRAPASPTG